MKKLLIGLMGILSATSTFEKYRCCTQGNLQQCTGVQRLWMQWQQYITAVVMERCAEWNSKLCVDSV